jgi:hypothetical protein
VSRRFNFIALSPLSNKVSHRDDRVYVSPVPPSGKLEDSRCATSPETLLPHVANPTPQPALRTKNPSLANTAKFLTPPPTPASPSHLPTLGMTSPTPEPPRDGVAPHKEPEVPEYIPTSVSAGSRFYTPVYPLLVETQMFEYFGMEYGISKRPPEGQSCSFI